MPHKAQYHKDFIPIPNTSYKFKEPPLYLFCILESKHSLSKDTLIYQMYNKSLPTKFLL